jgi:hypothetical protein
MVSSHLMLMVTLAASRWCEVGDSLLPLPTRETDLQNIPTRRKTIPGHGQNYKKHT